MSTILFYWYLVTGSIVVSGDHEGRTTYHIKDINIEHAYKREVINWIDTDAFLYDEDIPD